MTPNTRASLRDSSSWMASLAIRCPHSILRFNPGYGGTRRGTRPSGTVHSRCDLACDHCYVYEHADQSWRSRPTLIRSGTSPRAAERIAEHAKAHVRHAGYPYGGEPLWSRSAGIVRDALRSSLSGLDLRIHTNGVRLNDEFCEVSWWASPCYQRPTAGTRTGAAAKRGVSAAVDLLRQDQIKRSTQACSPPSTSGTSRSRCTVRSPLLSRPGLTSSSRTDILALPDADYQTGSGLVFDEWTRDGRPAADQDIRVDHRDHGVSATESLGSAPKDVVVIETDGMIEQADSISRLRWRARTASTSSTTHDDTAAHPGITGTQRRGIAGLAASAGSAPWSNCGGGLYAHRYRTGSGFMNPSVYCADLEKIITHVRADEAARRRPGHARRRPTSTPWPGTAMPRRSRAAPRRRSACRALFIGLRQRATENVDAKVAAGASSAAWKVSARNGARSTCPTVRSRLGRALLATRRRYVRGRRSPSLPNGH